MRKILGLLLLLAAFTPKAFGQGIGYTITPPVPNGTLYVCKYVGPPMPNFPCVNFATVYTTAALTTPVTLPVAMGAGGTQTFYGSPGQQFVVQIGVSGTLNQQFILSLPSSIPPGSGGAPATPSNTPGLVGSGASPVMGYYFGSSCPVANTSQCFFTAANTQVANDCTWSSGAATVTCATSHFAATDVGKRVMGFFKTDSFGSAFGCVAGRITFTSMTTGTLTIATYTSGTQIALNANPSNTATGNNGCVIWGTPDDTNASTFETAYAAVASSCVKVFLAAANYWFSSPHFSSQPTGCTALPSIIGSPSGGNMVYTAGFELEGRGPGNTVIYLGPDFPNGDTCTRAIQGITNACFLVPTEGKWSGLQISGGAQLACQVASNKTLIGVSVGTLENITLTNFCQNSAGGQIGIQADLLSQLYQVNNSGFGAACLQTVSGTGYIQAFKLACENSPGASPTFGSVDILAGSGSTPTFTCNGCLLLGSIASANMNVVNVASTAFVHLNNTVIANCEAGNGCTNNTSTSMIRNQGGKVYLTDVTMTVNGGAGPTNVNGLFNSVSGAIAYVRNTVFAAASSGFSYADAAGATLVDQGGNTGFASGAGPTTNGTISGGSQSASVGPLVTGNIGLTSGWGTSSVASVAAGGDSHRGRFTITGAAGSANPTLTLTFPTAYPVQAPASCTMQFDSAGAFTDFTQVVGGTPTKTAVIYTFTGTPTAVTITLDYVCGP